MKLKSVIIKNFRSYQFETKVDIGQLTAFIGKNDIGKSTILEALEIFFNNSLVKFDNKDACVHSDSKEVLIGCVFTDIPDEILIDTTKPTNLKDEYLLNQDGDLEIHKVFDCSKKSPTPTIIAKSFHPTAQSVSDLLTLKITDLKKRLQSLGISEDDVDLRSSSAIRKSIWKNTTDLKLDLVDIPLDKEDAKKIWDSLKNELPIFALFQSDRPSKDGDPEIQDPMKIAVSKALKSVSDDLEKIKKIVKKNAMEVATRTLDKLREMNPELANELVPDFKAEPKWDNIFNLTLDGDNEIPINKRGSGVRRLILLNFFRGEAEKKQEDKKTSSIIYAIEEPETSQHPSNQKMLMEAFKELSENDDCQVILTTHVPELAGLLPIESIRYVDKDENSQKCVRCGDEGIYKRIANELGILPDKRVEVFVCVEGPNDINFLNNISAIFHNKDHSLPNLETDYRIAVLPLGGGTLQQWVYNHYLKGFNLPEIHIYDRDISTPPKYEKFANQVNKRMDNSWATLTGKREMENYLHPSIINDFFDIKINFLDDDNVPILIVNAVNSSLDNKLKPISESKVKKLLNEQVVKKMTYELIQEVDINKDIEEWLKQIKYRIS